MYVSDYEQALFSLDPNLEKLRDLKEKYIRFNRSHADRPDEARSALDALIYLRIHTGFGKYLRSYIIHLQTGCYQFIYRNRTH